LFARKPLPREILGTSKMSSKYQITVPKDVRERFKLNADEILVFFDDDGRLLLRKNIE